MTPERRLSVRAEKVAFPRMSSMIRSTVPDESTHIGPPPCSSMTVCQFCVEILEEYSGNFHLFALNAFSFLKVPRVAH